MKVGNITVQDGGFDGPVYVSPEINGKDLTNVWALWIWNDGSAQLYTKRKKDGAVLGKPLEIKGPKHEHEFAVENSRTYRPCLKCGREFKTLYAGKKPA